MAVAYRIANWDTPLWILPNRNPARWNRAGGPPTQYLSLHPLTVWAEVLRFEDRRTPADAAEVRFRVWAAQVDERPLTEITFDAAADFGIAPADLVADDWSACQDLADRLRAEGVPGIVVPSAALPGTSNVVLFGPRVMAPYGAEPIDPVVDMPVSAVADRAAALDTLLADVRWRGQRHAGYEHWRRGRPYPLHL